MKNLIFFNVIYCFIELSFVLSHLYVFIGYKNPFLWNIRNQKYYFLCDAVCHLLNSFLFFSSKSDILRGFGLFLFFGHIHYFINLCKNDFPNMEENLCTILKWSCIKCNKKRFDVFESGSEMLQTAIDIVGHLLGAIFVMEQ